MSPVSGPRLVLEKGALGLGRRLQWSRCGHRKGRLHCHFRKEWPCPIGANHHSACYFAWYVQLSETQHDLLTQISDQHLAYADQITALDSNGRLRCSGPIDEVAPILGFSEIKAEWDALALEPAEEVESADENAPNTAPLEVVKPDDPTRRLGDSGMYKFYAQSAGAVPLLIFAACMAIYAFGGAFPCESSRLHTSWKYIG